MKVLISVCLLLCMLANSTVQGVNSTSLAATPVASPADRAVARHGAVLARRSPQVAARWLRHQSSVRSIRIGSDGGSILIAFRDGSTLAIWPAFTQPAGPYPAMRFAFNRMSHVAGPAPGRALILEPFATALGRGSDAGQQEASDLERAGFAVDIRRNEQVTIEVMRHLADYSVVYIETHSGLLDASTGDGFLLTGETDAKPYSDLFYDGTVQQGYATGDLNHLYVAVNSKFIRNHVGAFPNNSIVFLNGCEMLSAPAFLTALRSHNVAVTISWDDRASSAITDSTAALVFDRLAVGDSVSDTLLAAHNAGLDRSAGADSAGSYVAHLGIDGDGSDTLARARSGRQVTPTPTVMPTPTATATASPVPVATVRVSQKKKCKPGKHRVHGKCVKLKKKHH